MNVAGVHVDALVVDPPTPVQLSASENSNRSISAGSAMPAITLSAAHASLHADSGFEALAVRRPDIDAGLHACAREGVGEYPGFLAAFEKGRPMRVCIRDLLLQDRSDIPDGELCVEA